MGIKYFNYSKSIRKFTISKSDARKLIFKCKSDDYIGMKIFFGILRQLTKGEFSATNNSPKYIKAEPITKATNCPIIPPPWFAKYKLNPVMEMVCRISSNEIR